MVTNPLFNALEKVHIFVSLRVEKRLVSFFIDIKKCIVRASGTRKGLHYIFFPGLIGDRGGDHTGSRNLLRARSMASLGLWQLGLLGCHFFLLCRFFEAGLFCSFAVRRLYLRAAGNPTRALRLWPWRTHPCFLLALDTVVMLRQSARHQRRGLFLLRSWQRHHLTCGWFHRLLLFRLLQGWADQAHLCRGSPQRLLGTLRRFIKQPTEHDLKK